MTGRIALALMLLLGGLVKTAQGAEHDVEVVAAAAIVSNAVAVTRDVHYGEARLQTLDVYRPAHATAHAPLIMMVHGGGWRFGDKAMARMVESKVARWVPRGFVLVSMNYGLLPETPVARQIDDVAHALAYVQHHASEWGGDGTEVVLMGHSAGAHLVAMLGASPTRASAAGARPWLGTIVLDSAALDVPLIMQRRHMRLYDPAFGSDPAQWRALSPSDALEKSAPPLLVVCSTSRPDDSCAQAHAFVARAKSLGIRANVHEEALTHGEINFTLGVPGAHTDAVEAFMATLDANLRQLLQAKP